ncbi:hypothetical protein GW17_00023664 [Ensete ventricosum]|nr:hypothetical protein GW17_00023664 [Ensete ventricosum]
MQSDQGLGMEMGVGAGGECSSSAAAAEQQLLKAEMAVHPLWEQLLGAHVGCLRVATPIDHLPLIDAQLAQSHHLVRSYAAGRRPLLSPHEKQELDSFLAQYLMVLCSFREQLQQHVRVHAVEAVIACREIEQSLQDLTGTTTKTRIPFCLPPFDGDHVHVFMQGFRSRIEDVREEIIRKRRAGKLPGDTTSILKQWWQQNSKWPYPTVTFLLPCCSWFPHFQEDDKAKLVEETGLQLKQINNWFINQRKRNWHNSSQSATTLKSKRKK